MYGNQNNWFVGLANNTVSIGIDVDFFKRNLKRILYNSIHERCVENII
jgi:hypothetical protein